MTEHSSPRAPQNSRRATTTADVIVVGRRARPAPPPPTTWPVPGSTCCCWRRPRFPREKVCGDGLTPRAVKQLIGMGIDVGEQDGWMRNKGLRIIGGGTRLELPWPELASYPGFGLVRTRLGLRRDRWPARGQRPAPGCSRASTSPARSSTSAPAGSPASRPRPPTARRTHLPAPGSWSPRTATPPGCRVAMGLHKRDDRPLGVAVRTLLHARPRHDDDYLESWLDLWDGDRLLPGYGWIFGMGDGTSNVGLGLLNTSAAFGNTDYRALLRTLAGRHAGGVGLHRGEPDRADPRRGAADGLQPHPALHQGLLLVGDAGGMVNPFNGEGIAYAMESGEIAGPQRSCRRWPGRAGPSTERVLAGYPHALKEAYGGYYTLGRELRQADRQADADAASRPSTAWAARR